MGLSHQPADATSVLCISVLTGLQECSFQLGPGLPTQHDWGLSLCIDALHHQEVFAARITETLVLLQLCMQ